MSERYVVKPNTSGSRFAKWAVVDTTTGQVVSECQTKREAQHFARDAK